MEKSQKLIFGAALIFGALYFFRRYQIQRASSSEQREVTGLGFDVNLDETFADFPRFPAGEPGDNWKLNIEQWRNFAISAGDSFGVPPQLIMAVIWTESSGNPQALGDSVRAPRMGLMQISNAAASDVGFALSDADHQKCSEARDISDDALPSTGGLQSLAACFASSLMNPETNIKAGAAYLKRMFVATGANSWRQALHAYNWGIGNWNRVNGDLNGIPIAVREYAIMTLDRANLGTRSSYRPCRPAAQGGSC